MTIDYDGKYEYCNVASVNLKSEKQKLSIHPNPVTNRLSVESEYNTILRIFGHLGIEIQRITLQEGINEIGMSEYKEGIYIFRTENGEVERVVKL